MRSVGTCLRVMVCDTSADIAGSPDALLRTALGVAIEPNSGWAERAHAERGMSSGDAKGPVLLRSHGR